MGLMDFLFGKGLPYTRRQEIIHSVYNKYRAESNATRALREASKYADGVIRKEREQLYLSECELNAVVIAVCNTKSGNKKLWLDISGAGVNTLTIRNMNKFTETYGSLHINQKIFVIIIPYKTGYTFKIRYPKYSKKTNEEKDLFYKLNNVNGGKKMNNYNDAVYWTNEGNRLCDMGRREEALKCYYKALENDPGHLLALLNMATTLHELGRPKEVLKYSEIGGKPPITPLRLRFLVKPYTPLWGYGHAASPLGGFNMTVFVDSHQ